MFPLHYFCFLSSLAEYINLFQIVAQYMILKDF